MQRVLGLLGRKGAGKDTAAKVLTDRGWVRLAFADPLYREVAAAFDVTVEYLGNRDTKETPQPELALYKCHDQVFVAVMLAHAGFRLGAVEQEEQIREFLRRDRSPREIMQFWGTEYKRKVVRDDYWIEKVREVIRANPQTNFVITDVRFPNEAVMVKGEFGGTLARVVRPQQEKMDQLMVDVGLKHDSETVMKTYPVDIEFINEEGSKGQLALARAVLSRFKLKGKDTTHAGT